MRNWNAIIRPADFRLLSGEADLRNYQFGGKVAHHLFCAHCGVRPFGRGYVEAIGGEFVSVQLCTLDDVTPEELINAPVRHSNGRDDNWWAEPAETRHM